ncbi:MAG TPA: endonuclease III [Vicinamibacterales bacterium]|nr:endonuclease III [Vicinamibacterales bacterium]
MKPAPEVSRIFDLLDRHHPNADTELVHRNAFELLVATMLSAQSTDARVNLVTPALFARFPDAAALAKAKTSELEALILSTGFFRQKAKSLIGMATMLVDEHQGEVPADMDALTKLPGVGRKTANVVLGHALGVPGLPVDRHVLRVANRIGLVKHDDPVKVEAQLTAQLPPRRWTRASDALILHGRRICKPKPLCPKCNLRPHCDFYRTGLLTKPINRKIAADVIRRPAPRPVAAAKTRSSSGVNTRKRKRP